MLGLLPSNTSKLLAQWKGPFEITDKIGDVNYKVRVKRNKETVFHVNMLKPWFERQDDSQVSDIVACLQVIQGLNEEMEPETDFHVKSSPNLQANEDIGDINVASNLNRKQRRDLDGVLREFQDVFGDVPKKTHLVQHSVKLKTEEAVYMKPYPLPFALRERVQKELDSMLEAGIIEPSNSPFDAPIVLAKKKDASIRFCCDYRGFNDLTVFDPRPMPRMDDLLNKVS